jgi:hypothetical protein
MSIRFVKIWVQQCKATRGIKRRFGVKSALDLLDYLVREKLLGFADAAEQRPDFARELPRFLAEVWRIFNQYEIAGVSTLPTTAVVVTRSSVHGNHYRAMMFG